MKINLTTLEQVHQPVYILEESRLRRNLELISRVAQAADVEIILAFKAFALWRTFHIFREYISATTATRSVRPGWGLKNLAVSLIPFLRLTPIMRLTR